MARFLFCVFLGHFLQNHHARRFWERPNGRRSWGGPLVGLIFNEQNRSTDILVRQMVSVIPFLVLYGISSFLPVYTPSEVCCVCVPPNFPCGTLVSSCHATKSLGLK